ncbi:MAG TPA: nicotinamide riboside transporter PnuC, partial [Flavisolibacter sp.]|nr:nicotinamide riboside transporter PnuC [Flavisolibacter sp.]
VHQFMEGLRQTKLPEFIAVLTGIASVWLSKKENIWLYPVGLVNTIIYVVLSVQGELYGEASVNFYYTVVSIYGWIIWARKNEAHQHVLVVTTSTGRQWLGHLLFFTAFYIAIYCALIYLKHAFYANTIPWADAFASATAYTGMWLMARKKVESWFWWIATDFASVPLYFVKGFVFTSVYYFILLILAVSGWLEWKRRAALQSVTA